MCGCQVFVSSTRRISYAHTPYFPYNKHMVSVQGQKLLLDKDDSSRKLAV